MKKTVCNITIGSLQFDFVNFIDVESSYELLTDVARIILPSNITVKNEKIDNNQLSKHINNGDPVELQFGYDNDIKTVFKGYIKDIIPKVPIVIICEDEMYQLKKNTISDSIRSSDLKTLISKHIPQYETEVIDMSMGNYRFSETPAKFLDRLKTDFGIFSFFRDQKLHVGLNRNESTSTEHVFNLDYSNIISDNLLFKLKSQVQLKVICISHNSDGTNTEVEFGAAEGEQQTFHFYNVEEEELQNTAERKFNRLNYDGWRGDFTAFGEPFVRHGDIVNLKHENSEKAGRYWVDGVKYQFGEYGYQQIINLGLKL